MMNSENKFSFDSIDTDGIELAKKYIDASFNKGLDISPDGLESNLKDFIALYCAYKMSIHLEKTDAKEIFKKCFFLSAHLENQHNMFKYFGNFIKINKAEDNFQNKLFFFIETFEEMVTTYKARLPGLLNDICFLEDAFYRIHRQNRIGHLTLENEFLEKLSRVQNAILMIDLENSLSSNKIHKNKSKI